MCCSSNRGACLVHQEPCWPQSCWPYIFVLSQNLYCNQWPFNNQQPHPFELFTRGRPRAALPRIYLIFKDHVPYLALLRGTSCIPSSMVFQSFVLWSLSVPFLMFLLRFYWFLQRPRPRFSVNFCKMLQGPKPHAIVMLLQVPARPWDRWGGDSKYERCCSRRWAPWQRLHKLTLLLYCHVVIALSRIRQAASCTHTQFQLSQAS